MAKHARAMGVYPNYTIQNDINKEHTVTGERIFVVIEGTHGSFWERSAEQVNGEVFVAAGRAPVEVVKTKKVRDALGRHLVQVDRPVSAKQPTEKPLDIGEQPPVANREVVPPRGRKNATKG